MSVSGDENEMHKQSHLIERLSVHEEGLHNVYIKSEEEAVALENCTNKHTTLTV